MSVVISLAGTRSRSLRLGNLVLADHSVGSVARHVVDLAMSNLERVDGASVCSLTGVGVVPLTLAATSGDIEELDRSQYVHGDGPAVEALDGGESAWTGAGAPGAGFAARAARRGVRHAWCLPLVSHRSVTGSLNLYSRSAGPFHATEAAAARELAEEAGVALANVGGWHGARLAVERLERRLGAAAVIGRAEGILMASEDLDAAQAARRLADAGRSSGRPLHQVAAEVVATRSAPLSR